MTHYDARDARAKMMAHMLNLDADGDDDEEENPNRIIRSHGMHKSSGGGSTGGHGNTRLPFGLCMQYGIELPEDATPGDAWKALEGKGISQEAAYKHLAEHGTIEGFKGSKKVAPATGKVNPTEGLGEKKEKSAQPPVSEGNQPISEPTVTQGNQPVTETQTVQEGGDKVEVKKENPGQSSAQVAEAQNSEQAQQQEMATKQPAGKKEQAKKAKRTKTAVKTAKTEHEGTLNEYRKDPLNTPYKAPQYNYKELSASIKEQMAIAKANGDKEAYRYWSGEMKTLNTMRRDDKTIKEFDKKVAKPAQEAKGKVQDSKTSPGAAAKVLSLVLAAMLGPIGAAMGALLLRDKKKSGDKESGAAVEKEEEGATNKKVMSQDQIAAERERMSRQKERLDFEHKQAEKVFESGVNYGNLTFDQNAFTKMKDKVTNSKFAKNNPNYMKYLSRDMDAYGKSMGNLCGQIDAIRNNPDMSEAKKNAQLGKIARKCDNAVSRMDAGKYKFAEGRTKVYRYMTRNTLTEISKSLKGEGR
ncbi:MAG: hypothetical protein LUD47_07685 [Clostridia bacterium]|nr:hypothetical protein [Clostridia bacterium]